MIEPDVTQLSPHFNAARPQPRQVVIHATRSGISNFPREFEATLNWFSSSNSQASTHWVIDRDGTTGRCVPDNRQAWHAGESNAWSWGIELCQGVEADGFTEPQIDKLVEVCAGYCQDFGIPPAHVTFDAMHGFIGHEETSQGIRARKSDPGIRFDWNGFIARLGAFLEPPVPPVESKETTAMYLLGHPDDTRSFLVVGESSYHVPNGQIWDDLRELIYSGNPRHVSRETYDWLRGVGQPGPIIGGLPD
jgi:N-acetyl-anhydromuramyl-L-alanine amidase AmpD